VTRHVGGVHGPVGPTADELTNHLVLTVSDLPTEENPSGTWYVDAGLGDALHEALPLVAARYEQPPFHLSLEELDAQFADWHLTHDSAGAFTGMSWRAAPASMREFAARHEWLSTAPESGFVRVATAQRRDATGVDILRGLTLTRVGAGRAPEEPLTDRDDWFAALADIFDLTFDELEPAARDHLWRTVRTAHDEWEAAGRP
jgi:N-hydroxyarylamine O-acetyltransferase